MREGQLIERGVYLQVRSIVDIAFFFDTRQATSLHYNLFTLNHINILTGILIIGGRSEWIYGITFVN